MLKVLVGKYRYFTVMISADVIGVIVYKKHLLLFITGRQQWLGH